MPQTALLARLDTLHTLAPRWKSTRPSSRCTRTRCIRPRTGSFPQRMTHFQHQFCHHLCTHSCAGSEETCSRLRWNRTQGVQRVG